MKKLYILISCLILLAVQTTKAQWQTHATLTDLNTWSSQSGFIG